MTAYKNQKRQFWIILLIVFLGFVGISMPYLIFPSLFLNPSYSILPPSWGEAPRAVFLGITLAAYPLGQFIGSPILGTLSDEYGRKKLLIGSLLVTGICSLLSGFAISKHYLGLLIISRFLTGVMEGNIAIARAMAADLKLLSKHLTFGRINASASISYLIGPLFGAFLADKHIWSGLTTSTPFFFMCILFFCLAALSLFVLQESLVRVSTHVKTFWQRINFIKRMSVLFSNKLVKSLMLTSTLFGLAVDMFYEFGPVYLTLKWDLIPAQLIVYNFVLCLALAVGNGWLPTFLALHMSNRTLIISAIGFFALSIIGIVFTNSQTAMVLFFAVCGLGIGLAATLITVLISDSVDESKQGEVLGTQISLRVLGDGVICLFGGMFLIFSSKIILMISVAISILSLGYYSGLTFVLGRPPTDN